VGNGFYSQFHVVKEENNNSSFSDTTKFSQIAYGIRPMVFSCMNAYDLLKDSLFLNTAINAVKWFFKNNPAGALMYDPQTGRGYDGVIDFGKINTNSGAESTIESLLSILRLEKDNNSKSILLNIFNKL
jgi:hypothetical protein